MTKQQLVQVVEDFNSQVQEQQLAPQKQVMKVWQMLDDAIKTKRYIQCRGMYDEKGDQRCMVGLFASYRGWKATYTDGDVLQDFIVNTVFDGEGAEIAGDKADHFATIRRQYEEDGKINQDLIVILNDRFNVTFEEFRDFFKEMDI